MILTVDLKNVINLAREGSLCTPLYTNQFEGFHNCGVLLPRPIILLQRKTLKFDLHKMLYIHSEQFPRFMSKVSYCIYFQDLVTLLHPLIGLNSCPRSCEHSLSVRIFMNFSFSPVHLVHNENNKLVSSASFSWRIDNTLYNSKSLRVHFHCTTLV